MIVGTMTYQQMIDELIADKTEIMRFINQQKHKDRAMLKSGKITTFPYTTAHEYKTSKTNNKYIIPFIYIRREFLEEAYPYCVPLCYYYDSKHNDQLNLCLHSSDKHIGDNSLLIIREHAIQRYKERLNLTGTKSLKEVAISMASDFIIAKPIKNKEIEDQKYLIYYATLNGMYYGTLEMPNGSNNLNRTQVRIYNTFMPYNQISREEELEVAREYMRNMFKEAAKNKTIKEEYFHFAYLFCISQLNDVELVNTIYIAQNLPIRKSINDFTELDFALVRYFKHETDTIEIKPKD